MFIADRLFNQYFAVKGCVAEGFDELFLLTAGMVDTGLPLFFLLPFQPGNAFAYEDNTCCYEEDNNDNDNGNDAVQIGIDENRDFYNEDHMNVYGALKFTDYLADKLVNNEKLQIDPLSEYQQEAWKQVVTSTNQLYRYCDDIMTNGETRGAQEDVVTLLSLDSYSGATIERK